MTEKSVYNFLMQSVRYLPLTLTKMWDDFPSPSLTLMPNGLFVDAMSW